MSGDTWHSPPTSDVILTDGWFLPPAKKVIHALTGTKKIQIDSNALGYNNNEMKKLQ